MPRDGLAGNPIAYRGHFTIGDRNESACPQVAAVANSAHRRKIGKIVEAISCRAAVTYQHTATGAVRDASGAVRQFMSAADIGNVGRGAFQQGENTIQFTIFNQGFAGSPTGPGPGAFRFRARWTHSPTPCRNLPGWC